jgi:hypothetical protein
MGGMIIILPTWVQFPQVTCLESIVVIASSLVVDRPCALKIVGFTLGTILEMRRSTQGFFSGLHKMEKKNLTVNEMGKKK